MESWRLGFIASLDIWLPSIGCAELNPHQDHSPAIGGLGH